MRKLIFFLLLGSALAQTPSKVRSVQALPSNCNPGGGIGGAMADHIDLWNGAINIPMYCSATNTWNAISGGWVVPGTAAAPGLPAPGTLSLGFYAGPGNAVWTVSATSSSGGTATVTVGNSSGYPYGFRVNDYIVTTAIGGGYDCALATPCQITAINSGASTISYLSAGVGNQTSGSVQAYTIGIAAQKMIFNSLQSSTANAANSGSLQLAAQDNIKAHDVLNSADVILLRKNGDPSTADTRSAQCGDDVYGCMVHASAPFVAGGTVSIKGPWTLSSPQPSGNTSSALNLSLFTLATDGFWYMTGKGLGASDPQGQVVFATQPGAGAGPSAGTADQIPIFQTTGVANFINLPSSTCYGLSYTPVSSGGSSIGCESTPVAFASLPACSGSLEGRSRPVNNSTTNTWGATITGGGTNHVLGYCDGTNWTVSAK